MDVSQRASTIWEMIQHFSSSAPTQKGRLQVMSMELQASGIAEPGMPSDLVLLGDFSPISIYDPDQGGEVVIDDSPSQIRLKALELGILVDKKDRWISCDRCSRLLQKESQSQFNNLTKIFPALKLYWIDKNGLIVCHLCTVGSTLTEYVAKYEGKPAIMTMCVDLTTYNLYDLGHDYYDSSIDQGGGKDNDGSSFVARELESYGIKRFVFKQTEGNSRFKTFIHGTELRSDAYLPDTSMGQRLRTLQKKLSSR